MVISCLPVSWKFGSFLASLFKAWIGWSPIPTLMKFSSTNWPIPVTSGSLLLVEHRAAVAGEAARPAPAARCGSKEQLGAAKLRGRQRAIVAGQEPVEARVPGDRGAQEGRRCP